GAVADERGERAGDLLARPALVPRRAPAHQVGLEPVAAGLVEEHAAGALLEDDGDPAARGGAGLEHLESAAGGGAGGVLDVDLVVELEADGAARPLVARLHAGVADRHALHHEPGADLDILD